MNSEKAKKVLNEDIEIQKCKEEKIGKLYMRVRYIAICPECNDLVEFDAIEPISSNTVWCYRCDKSFAVKPQWEIK